MHEAKANGCRPLLFGEVLFDCFEEGSRVLGGAPFNVAWHLQAFGLAPLLVSRVGQDQAGEQIIDSMRRWGMDISGIQRDKHHPTGEVSITLNDGQPDFNIVDFSAWDYIEPDIPPNSNISLIYHGTLALRHAPSAHALAVIVARFDAPVFLDVNLRQPWWERERSLALVSRADYLKINESELALLGEQSETPYDDARRLLQERTLERIIVTLGERGGFAMDRQGETHDTGPVQSVDVVDSVGAGDAFAAVCILGLVRNWPVKSTMQRAQQFACLLVTRRGATIDDRRLYQDFLDRWRS